MTLRWYRLVLADGGFAARKLLFQLALVGGASFRVAQGVVGYAHEREGVGIPLQCLRSLVVGRLDGIGSSFRCNAEGGVESIRAVHVAAVWCSE